MSSQGWFVQVTSGDCCGAMWCPVGHTSVGHTSVDHTYVLRSVVVMLQLMDEGQQLSKRQLELEGQTKRLRQQVKQLETQVRPILVWEQPPLSSVSCMAPIPMQLQCCETPLTPGWSCTLLVPCDAVMVESAAVTLDTFACHIRPPAAPSTQPGTG